VLLVPAGGVALSVVPPVPPVAPGAVLSVAPGVVLMLPEVPPALPGGVPVAPGVVLPVVLPGLVVAPPILPDAGLSLLLVPAVLPVVPELLAPLSAPRSQATKARDATNALSNTEYFMLFPLKKYCCRKLPFTKSDCYSFYLGHQGKQYSCLTFFYNDIFQGWSYCRNKK